MSGKLTFMFKINPKNQNMKKRNLQSKLTLNKQTIVELSNNESEAVKGGQSLACIQSRLVSCLGNCVSVRNPCITQTENETCRCV